jgi:tellurite resistance protein TerC
MHPDAWLWIGLNLLIVAMLLVDLLVFHRRPHEVRMREAITWSVVWILVAGAFNVGLWMWRGPQAGLEFLTAYLVEKSLSVDNLFVFLLVFSTFAVPREHQHGVLFWGILGALVTRLGFILVGVALLERFHALIYVFGLVLVVSGLKLWGAKDKTLQPEKNPVLRLFRRLVPVTETFEGGRFFVRRAGRRLATPLAVVLVVVESTDIVFALDSIPAVLAITRDPFIAYASNAFAILGLRALYFALAGFMQAFHYLHHGLSALLVFIGGKMIASDLLEIPTGLSLGVVAAILGVSVAASLLRPRPVGPAASPGAGPAEGTPR